MRRRLRESEPVNYWKSMVDVITVLMMVILLILMFFVLNFLANDSDKEFPDNDYDGYDAAYDYNPHDGYGEPTVTPTPTPTPVPHDHDNDGGGGGAGETEPIETQPGEEGTELEGLDKAAVYAILVDEDTEQTIAIEGAVFELYTIGGAKQTLATHYPELVTYTQFKTTDGGWFYLPEKIRGGNYYFHQISEIPGYDYTLDVPFEVEESHDWNDPIIVKIPLGAAKNNIQIQLNDATTKKGIAGVVFDVVSDGSNITPDGTIRYKDGEVVDSIKCDETGYGLSVELYLGNYLLVPRNLPFGYAAPELSTRKVVLEKRTEAGSFAPLTVMESGLTRVNVTITDELENNRFIPNMQYTLISKDESEADRVFVTNTAGFFEVTWLNKNTTYVLVETETANGYIANEEVIEFTVDSLGYIDSASEKSYEITNRMIRIEIATVDRVLRRPLAGYSLTLYDEQGKVVEHWISDGTTHHINGLDTGVYKLKIENSDDEMIIVVENVKEVQKYSSNVMTKESYILLAFIGLLIVAVILTSTLALVNYINKMKAKRKSGTK